MKDKTIEELKSIGFKEVGYWIINDNAKLSYKLINAETNSIDHLLYAFENKNIVKYIGITENTFKNRMGLYISGHNEKSSGSTNKRIYKEIKTLLENKQEVKIYILKENATCDFKGYEISLATGLEKSLIKAFDLNQQLWNKRGANIKSDVREKKQSKSKPNIKSEKLSKKQQMVYDWISKKQPICDDCIGEDLKFNKRQSANSIANKLEKNNYITRNKNNEHCPYCKSENSIPKILNRTIK